MRACAACRPPSSAAASPAEDRPARLDVRTDSARPHRRARVRRDAERTPRNGYGRRQLATVRSRRQLQGNRLGRIRSPFIGAGIRRVRFARALRRGSAARRAHLRQAARDAALPARVPLAPQDGRAASRHRADPGEHGRGPRLPRIPRLRRRRRRAVLAPTALAVALGLRGPGRRGRPVRGACVQRVRRLRLPHGSPALGAAGHVRLRSLRLPRTAFIRDMAPRAGAPLGRHPGRAPGPTVGAQLSPQSAGSVSMSPTRTAARSRSAWTRREAAARTRAHEERWAVPARGLRAAHRSNPWSSSRATRARF